MKIGNKIKGLRKQKGFTQDKLANLSNISRTYLADIERNRYNPSMDTLSSIAKTLDVQLAQLLECNTISESDVEDVELQKLICKVEKLYNKDKEFIIKLIDKLGGD